MNKIITTLGIVGTLAFGGGTVVDNQINPYTDKNTHYELSVKSDIPQNDRVEISKDKPSVTLSRWNDEERVTIEPKFRGAGKILKANRPLLSKRMEFKKGAVTAFVEPKTGTEFDIDFTLDSKPTYNIFEYAITGAEDMDFFYQPALTQEEIEWGAERPDNVVGSYAVYHKDKKNNCINCGTALYGTGKLFHIYRPEAIDAGGNRVWAILDYKKGILSVTVPQEFLDTAIYPVRVDPTFGYTSIGLSEFSFYDTPGARIGNYYNSPSNGTINSLSAYVSHPDESLGQWTTSTNYNGDYVDFVYNNGYFYYCLTTHTSSSITEPGVGANWATYWEVWVKTTIDFKAIVNQKDSVASGSHGQIDLKATTGLGLFNAQWQTLDLNDQSISNGVDYIFNIVAEPDMSFTTLAYDSIDYSGTNSIEYKDFFTSYASPADPWVIDLLNPTGDDVEWGVSTAYYVNDYIFNLSSDGYIHFYVCISDHTSTVNDEPDSGVNWETYWVEDGIVVFRNYSIYATYTASGGAVPNNDLIIFE